MKDSGRDKTRYFRVALNWVLPGRFTSEAELGTSNPRYRAWIRPSTTGITVERDEMAKPWFGICPIGRKIAISLFEDCER